jgi:hypothetical protein
MSKYRKLPVVIDAWRFSDRNAMARYTEPLPDWLRTNDSVRFLAGTVEIRTLEGTMVAIPGDWIIKGVKGELYPCKPDIFAATYEEVPPTVEIEIP